MDIQFGNLAALHYLWVVMLVVLTIAFAAYRRRRSRSQFATPNLLPSIIPRTRWSTMLHAILTVGALTALVLAMIDIRWGKTWRDVPQKGIEVVFALDVSKSMLAEDVAPNRLDRAKQYIKDMVDEMSGDRIGLIVFAGDARRKIPLTTHYEDFKRTLDEVGPHDVRRGGSNLGEAIKTAAESFLTKTSDHKTIVLITDGEDHESKPVEVASSIHDRQGVRVFTIGIGDSRRGARVPEDPTAHQFLEYQGQPVWSKLDGKILKAIAQKTDGAYIPAETKLVDMALVYHKYIANVEKQDFATARINSYIPRFQWFLGLSLFLSIFDAVYGKITFRPARSTRSIIISSPEPTKATRTTSKSAALAAAVLLAIAVRPVRASESTLFELAEQAYQAAQQGDYDNAAQKFHEASELDPGRLELRYNEGLALFRKGDTAAAGPCFAEAIATADRQLEAKAHFYLGNCDYADALKAKSSEPDTAIQLLKTAITHYRDALAADPSDQDARANIELAAQLIKQLQQQQQQQQQNQDQQQQDQQQQDQQSQDQQQQDQQQQDQQQQNQQQQQDQQQDQQQQQQQQQDQQQDQQQQNQDQQQQNSNSQDGSSQEDQSQRASDESDSEPKDTNEQQQEDKSSESQDKNDNTDTEQQQSEHEQESEQDRPRHDQQTEQENDRRNSQANKDQSDESAMDEQKNDQPPPTGELESIQDEDQTKRQAESAMVREDAMKPMTKQEALKMLQAVRDRDLMRRIQRLRRTKQRYIPGEKDW